MKLTIQPLEKAPVQHQDPNLVTKYLIATGECNVDMLKISRRISTTCRFIHICFVMRFRRFRVLMCLDVSQILCQECESRKPSTIHHCRLREGKIYRFAQHRKSIHRPRSWCRKCVDLNNNQISQERCRYLYLSASTILSMVFLNLLHCPQEACILHELFSTLILRSLIFNAIIMQLHEMKCSQCLVCVHENIILPIQYTYALSPTRTS